MPAAIFEYVVMFVHSFIALVIIVVGLAAPWLKCLKDLNRTRP